MGTIATGSAGGRAVEAAARLVAVSPWVRAAARVGYVAKSLVYAVVALLALLVAARAGGRTTDARGAIATLSRLPWGTALVVALAAGLVAHGAWLVIDAVADPARESRGAWGAVKRVGKALVGAAYGGLAWSALQLAAGSGARSGNAEARSWTARALELPAGELLVLIGGGVVLAVGVRQIWQGAKKLRDSGLRLGEMGPRLRAWAPRIGCAGLATQGAVFALVGGFFVRAALAGSAREARGFDGALAWLSSRQPYGTALLAAAGAGLVAYAAWAALEARYKPLAAA